ncbi:hypothetical protein COOONC_15969 [Cooperia oncophora]
MCIGCELVGGQMHIQMPLRLRKEADGMAHPRKGNPNETIKLVLFHYSGWNNYDPFRPDFNPLPPDFFNPVEINQAVERAVENAGRSGGIIVNSINGVTTVQAIIGGRPYTAVFPAGSISTFRNDYARNGNYYEVFTIVINGFPYIYTTVNGRTTVTDGRGRVLRNGGPFRVLSG